MFDFGLMEKCNPPEYPEEREPEHYWAALTSSWKPLAPHLAIVITVITAGSRGKPILIVTNHKAE